MARKLTSEILVRLFCAWPFEANDPWLAPFLEKKDQSLPDQALKPAAVACPLSTHHSEPQISSAAPRYQSASIAPRIPLR